MYLHFLSKLKVLRQSTYLWILIYRDKFDVNITPSKFVTNIFHNFQVRLPRNQLAVLRVSPKTTVSEVLKQVCYDKGLDLKKYEARHPGKDNILIFKKCHIGYNDSKIFRTYLYIFIFSLQIIQKSSFDQNAHYLITV